MCYFSISPTKERKWFALHHISGEENKDDTGFNIKLSDLNQFLTPIKAVVLPTTTSFRLHFKLPDRYHSLLIFPFLIPLNIKQDYRYHSISVCMSLYVFCLILKRLVKYFFNECNRVTMKIYLTC